MAHTKSTLFSIRSPLPKRTAFLLGFVAPYRGVGIWFGLAAGLAAVAVVLTIRFAMRDRIGLTRHAPA